MSDADVLADCRREIVALAGTLRLTEGARDRLKRERDAALARAEAAEKDRDRWMQEAAESAGRRVAVEAARDALKVELERARHSAGEWRKQLAGVKNVSAVWERTAGQAEADRDREKARAEAAEAVFVSERKHAERLERLVMMSYGPVDPVERLVAANADLAARAESLAADRDRQRWRAERVWVLQKIEDSGVELAGVYRDLEQAKHALEGRYPNLSAWRSCERCGDPDCGRWVAHTGKHEVLIEPAWLDGSAPADARGEIDLRGRAEGGYTATVERMGAVAPLLKAPEDSPRPPESPPDLTRS